MNFGKIFEKVTSLGERIHDCEKCGHHTKRVGVLNAFGETRKMRMPLNEHGKVDYCWECLSNMTILCGWCTKPIFIAEPITLYSSTKEDYVLPPHAVMHDEKRRQIIGCLRWDCADTGADRAGFWMPGEKGKGRVFRVPTPFEIMFGQAEAGKKPEPMIINDLSDFGAAQQLTAEHVANLKDKKSS